MSEVQIDKEARIVTYADLWSVSRFHLRQGTRNPEGSYFMFLSSLLFSAFSFEAFLNHLGEKLFESWNDLEKLSPRSKLNVICERVGVVPDYGAMPWQIVPMIVSLRNKVAHGKSVVLSEQKKAPIDRYEEVMHEALRQDWQEKVTQEYAESVRAQLAELYRIVHGAAKIEDDKLLVHGMQFASATILREDALHEVEADRL